MSRIASIATFIRLGDLIMGILHYNIRILVYENIGWVTTFAKKSLFHCNSETADWHPPCDDFVYRRTQPANSDSDKCTYQISLFFGHLACANKSVGTCTKIIHTSWLINLTDIRKQEIQEFYLNAAIVLPLLSNKLIRETDFFKT